MSTTTRKPCLVNTYYENEFVRPRKVISSQCPCCGQAWKLPVNARMCPKCGLIKYLSDFPTKHGMCRACKAERITKSYRNQADYQHQYYLTRTKLKRQQRRQEQEQTDTQTAVNE